MISHAILGLALCLPALTQDASFGPAVPGRLAQDKVELRFTPRAGDVLTLEAKISGSVKAKVDGQDIDLSFRNSNKSHSTHLEVEGGKTVKKEIHIESDIEEQKGPGAEEFTANPQPLHGKKITITLKEGKPVIEGADDVDEKQRKKLRLEEEMAYLLPKKAVGVGDSWEVTGDDLKAAMGHDEALGEGKISFTVKEIKEIDKRRCLVATATWDLSGTAEEGFKVFIKLEGEEIFWIERGVALSFKGTGTVKVSVPDSGFEGSGPVTVESKASLRTK
jgi:hypothetical protein